MSAIAGIIRFGGSPVTAAEAECLAAGVRAGQREPGRIWRTGEAALIANGAEKSSGASDGPAPLVSIDGRHVLVFDGRLDNRPDLQRILGDGDLTVTLKSDAELAMAAWRRWSEDSPARFLGDFAFAVWDTQSRRLFCARDVCGARPFYYVCNPGFFAFASEEETLVRLPGVSGKPCAELLAYFLVRAFQDVPADQSWLEDVKTLLPAHRMTVTPAGTSSPDEYWRFEQGAIARRASVGEHQEAFIEVFGEAVRCRMSAQAQPAAILSGGMDSAALAAMMGRVAATGQTVPTDAYSVISDDVDSSLESRAIRSITSPPGMRAHYLRVPSLGGATHLSDLADAVWGAAHPVSNAIPITSMMCLAAHRDGQDVLLHAPCGDLTMGYEPHYLSHILRRKGLWNTWREARAASDHHTFLEGQPAGRLMLRALWAAYAPGTLRRYVRRIRAAPPREPQGLHLLNPDFARSLAILERIQSRSADGWGEGEAGFRRRHADSVFGPYGVAQTLAGGQRVGSRYGVDLSDPWADKRVLEYFLHLPIEYLFRDGWTKYLARVAFAEDLEDWVRFRSDKEHLGWALVDRLLRESGEFVDQTIENELDCIGEYVNPDRVRELHREYRSSGEPAVAEQIYDIMTLLLWVRRLQF